jgi:hypothetical protein
MKPAGPQPVDEAFYHAILLERLNSSITSAKLLCSEAYKAGDMETVWVCQASIKELERQKASLRPPTPGAKYTPRQ